jgi:hypothetical protein
MMDPRYYGILLDGTSSDNKFTLLLSQGGFMHNVPKFSKFQDTRERSPVLTFGGHWETQLGNVLKLGATYYNQHMMDTFNDKGSLLQGDMPHSMLPPSYITVAIEDDSPEDAATPAVVYGVEIIVTGTSLGQPVRLTSMDLDPDYDPTLEGVVRGGTLRTDGGREAQGQAERVLYEFQMPEFMLPAFGDYAANPDVPLAGITIESVQFVADVAGDYRIAVRQEHLLFNEKDYEYNIDKEYGPGDSKYRNPFTGLRGDDALLTPIEAKAAGEEIFNSWPVNPADASLSQTPFLQYKWDQFPQDVYYTVVRSEGQNANRKQVSFAYGIPTGQSLYGMDGELTLKGFTLKGEFVTNPQNFIFPVGSNAGERYSKRTWAYFLTATKDVGSFQFGGELFKLDPDYSGNYDSFRGGIPFFTDQSQTGPQMQEMFIMNDNDDNDQWADDGVQELLSADKIDSGIFPGLDENQDLVADSDQNLNGIPDWSEPILFYDAEPPEFTYGIDFNNNGVVDFRENDRLPDYPYRKDRKGWHALVIKDDLGMFGRWASIGMYRLEEVAQGSEANALYGRYEYGYTSPYFGKLRINADVKWVKDDIRDDVYVWKDYSDDRIPSPFPQWTGTTIEEWDLNSQIIPPDPDPLTMRNSFVNTVFFESRIRQITGLNIVNNIQWVRNSQREDEFDDGSVQDEDILSLITMVNKADYTIKIGGLNIRPMFKHLLMRRHSDKLDREVGKGSIESLSIYTPVLRTTYTFTPKSELQIAFQGFPFWRYRKLDRVDEIENFKEWTTVVMMSNRSDQYGFNLGSQFGWIKSSREYDDESRAIDNQDNARIFFDIVAGW